MSSHGKCEGCGRPVTGEGATPDEQGVKKTFTGRDRHGDALYTTWHPRCLRMHRSAYSVRSARPGRVSAQPDIRPVLGDLS
jgi:hypothetical protein